MKTGISQYTNIKVIGVGGGGNNAVNRMVKNGLEGVEFWAINTDNQALHSSLAENILQIGVETTKGLGAGSNPLMGEKSAEESMSELTKSIEGADMVFITAGMGGGTGTGASPVIAKMAKQGGALTIGVVTKPFRFEGPIRMRQAEQGISALRDEVDALIIIPNDKLLQVIEQTTTLKDAFMVADDVLLQGVMGISKMITDVGLINLDFADVKAIMSDAGSAMMGIGKSSGSQRAIEAAEAAISSPLLEESITGAKGIILNIAGGESLSMYEVNEAAQVIYDAVDPNAHIILGTVIDESLNDEIVVTVIATGFKPVAKKEVYAATIIKKTDTEDTLSHKKEFDEESEPESFIRPFSSSKESYKDDVEEEDGVSISNSSHSDYDDEEDEEEIEVVSAMDDDISIPSFLRRRKR
ncbi:MAG: cell division protein FtsZ [Candidatus Margulisbacteria bacterium GWF2_35_9]|nr:MAG: cell division protein FtsZ [Candidatus Margulisbacteria bacterium GWF2_35_9]